MQQKLRIVAALIALFLFAGSRAVWAAPPTIDATPALGPALVQERWQSLLITLTNPDSGTALQGEVQVMLEEPRTGNRLATYTHTISLPRGAGTARVPVYLFIPSNQQPDIFVYVVNGRNGTGEVVTRRKFDKLPILPGQLTLAAVTTAPDALHYLQAETFPVLQTGGVLAPLNAGTPTSSYNGRRQTGPSSLQVVPVADPASLPDRAIGYDSLGILYLGADIPPDALADAQVEAIRGWVVGGGFLVTGGNRWRQDERFRPVLPIPSANTDSTTHRFGRGSVTSLDFDPVAPDFARRPEAVPIWRNIIRAGTARRSIGRMVAADMPYGWNSFAASVLRAPGLRAPGYGAVGMFLVAYLVLLVPINYALLKRIDRREWAWWTVPVLVLVFSLGAYAFGYTTKGARVILNTASVVEMGNGSGDALVHIMAGVFSPARTSYHISNKLPDAVFWSPRSNNEADDALVVSQNENGGAEVRDAAIPMWAMRVFGSRSSHRKLGDGITVNAHRKGKRITAIVTNRTGILLQQITVMVAGASQHLSRLAPGEAITVQFGPGSKEQSSHDLWPVSPSGKSADANLTISSAIAESLGQVVTEAEEAVNDKNPESLSVTAWSFDPLIPVQVDGHTPGNGANVNLIRVDATLNR